MLFNTQNNSLQEKVLAAFKIFCCGNNIEIPNAQQFLEDIKNNSDYPNVLLNFLSINSIEKQIKILASIELKNTLNYLFTNRILNKITENEKQNFLNSILQIYLQCSDRSIVQHLSLSVLSILKFSDQSILEKVILLAKENLNEQKGIGLNFKSLQLLHDIFQQLEDMDTVHFALAISTEIFDSVFSLWKIDISIFFSDNFDINFLEDGILERMLICNKIVYFIVCNGTQSEQIYVDQKFEILFKELHQFLTHLISKDFILQCKNDFYKEKLESIFETMVDIFKTCRNRHSFEFLKFLNPFFEFSFNVLSTKENYGEKCYLILLKFIQEVISCKEYRPTHIAAFVLTKQNVNRQMAEKWQNDFMAYISHERMHLFINLLLSKFIFVNEDDLNNWEENSEKYYIENVSAIYSNKESISLKIINEYSRLFPRAVADLLLQAINSDFNAKNSQNLLKLMNLKYSIYKAISCCYEEIADIFNEKNFNIFAWFSMIERDIFEASKINKKVALLPKLAFCYSFKSIFKNFEEKSFLENKSHFLEILCVLLSDEDITIQLETQHCLKRIGSKKNDFLIPFLPTIIKNCFNIFCKVEDTGIKMYLIDEISQIFFNFGKNLKECYFETFNRIKQIWNLLKNSESLLKLKIIEFLITILNIFPNDLNNLEELYTEILINSTNVENPNLSYLNEKGFELFNIVLQYSPSLPNNFNRYFESALKFLSENKQTKICCKIIENSILLNNEIYNQFGREINQLILNHLEKNTAQNILPVLNLLILIERIFKGEILRFLPISIIDHLKMRFLNGLKFSGSVQFEISFKILNFFALMIIYTQKEIVTIINKTSKNAFFNLLKIIADTFERVPYQNIRRNYEISLLVSITFSDAQIIQFVLPPALTFAVQIIRLENNEGKMTPPEIIKNPAEWTFLERNQIVMKGEEINFVDLKQLLAKCVATARKNCPAAVDLAFSSVEQNVILALGKFE